MTDITLHQWELSPFCTKVRLMLDYKGMDYKTKNYNGMLAIKVRAVNRAGKLPVLEVDGQLIPDSRDIALYLDQLKPEKPLFPKDKVTRAKAELMANWADESLYFYEIYLRAKYDDAFNQLLSSMSEERPTYEKYIFSPALKRTLNKALHHHGTSRESKQKVETRFLNLMLSLDACLSKNPWLAGKEISIADFSVAGQLTEVLRTSHLAKQLLDMPHLGKWIETFSHNSLDEVHLMDERTYRENHEVTT